MNLITKIKKAISIICAAAVTVGSTAVYAADTIDISFDCSQVPVLEPWVSTSFSMEHYDPTKISLDSEVIVTYSYTYIDDGQDYSGECPIELIVQSWSYPDTPMANASGGVWAKVAPFEWDDTTAKFSMDDMIAAYGTSDFSGVDSINIGATASANLTVTSFTITNCSDDIYIEMTDAERAEAYKNALIIVLASALAVIIIIIVVFMIILKRKTGYAYDAATGEYVKMQKKPKSDK